MKDLNVYELAKEQVVVTAEIGINHNGDLTLALEMIDAAADCGADAVKFQAFKTPYMYSRLTPGFSHTETDVFTQIQKLEIKDDWWPRLRERTRKHGLLFSASIFDEPSMEVLKPVGVDFLKIASSEIVNHSFLKSQKELSDIYVVSTGASTLDEISETMLFLESIGLHKIILLECTSSYPAPPESVNLLNIDFLKNTFKCPPGFSDHTLGIHYAVAAAARGARFIEKHFTLDRKMEGPDQKISADPGQLKELVQSVRDIEASMKSNRKMTVSPHEEGTRNIGRKSVIARSIIKKGEAVSLENTIIKRPANGIPPHEAPYLMGRIANRDIPEDQWITWEMVD
jgi:N,N'-diacetyllegionaminate synthase